MNTVVEERRVWSLPLRVFHWGLVLSVTIGWLLGEFGPIDRVWHMRLGYATGALVLFRIALSFTGGPETSLRSLIVTPRALIDYVKHLRDRAPSDWHGHNPLGGLSVLAMLAALSVQVVTGLFSDDEIFASGPLASSVTSRTASMLTGIHDITAKVVLVLVLTHVAAVVFYLIWKRENLVRPMITGWKRVRRDRDR